MDDREKEILKEKAASIYAQELLKNQEQATQATISGIQIQSRAFIAVYYKFKFKSICTGFYFV